MSKKLFIYFLIFIIAASFFIVRYRSYSIDKSVIHGYIYQSQRWDQYDQTVMLTDRYGNEIQRTKTKVNGYFLLKDIRSGRYILHVPNLDYHQKISKRLYQLFLGKIKISTPQIAFPSIYILSFIISLVYLVFSWLLFLKVADRKLAISFVLFSAPPFWVNLIDSIQAICSFANLEIFAARLFYIKYAFLIFSAVGLLWFFSIFPMVLAKLNNRLFKTGIIFALGIIICILFIAAFLLPNEIVFQYIFFMSFPFLVKLSITLLGLAVLFATGVLFYNFVNSPFLKVQLKPLLNLFVVFAAAYYALILHPVLFLNSHEFFKYQFLLFDTFGVLIFFLIFAYVVFRQRAIKFEAVINKSILYTFLAGVYTCLYIWGVEFARKAVLTSEAYLNIFMFIAVFIFIIIFNPLKNIIEKLLDSWFGPPYKDLANFIAKASQKIIKILDRSKLAQATHETYTALDGNLVIRVNLLEDISAKNYWCYETKQSFALPPVLKKYFEENISFSEIDNKIIKEIWADFDESSKHFVIPYFVNQLLEGFVVLEVNKYVYPFGPKELELLEILKGQIGIGLLNSRLYYELASTYQKYKETQEEVQLASRLSMVGSLAAGLAHEIKNPLAAMQPFIQLFPERYTDDEYREQFLQVIPRQLQKIKDLVTQMLEYGKEREIKLEKISLKKIIEKNVQLLFKKASNQKIVIKNNVQEDCYFHSDAVMWDEVILNLLINAMQAIKQNGSIIVDLLKEKNKNILSIVDTGRGIPEEQLKKIFNPFFTTKTEGTGIGLSLVKRNMMLLGHAMTVKSKVGQGTEFRIIL